MSSEANYLSIVYEHAVSRPDAVAFEHALDDEITSLTYGDLVERVQQLGEALRVSGLGDGSRVAICMENRPAWPVAYLAVWYAGGVTVPLDTAPDESVLARLIEHSGAVACVTSVAFATKLQTACETIAARPLLLVPEPSGITTSGDGTSFATFIDQNGTSSPVWNPSIAGETDLGTIMYTSGTTGDPKGVMIRQRCVLENLRAGIKRVHFTPEERILGVLPLFHVLPLITNCLGPLYLGARVVFLHELTAEGIIEAFRRHRITVFVCVPAFFYRFHDKLTHTIDRSPWVRRKIARALIKLSGWVRRRFGWSIGRRLLKKAHQPFGDDMRLFITGGAKMNAEVFDDFLDWGFQLAQGYGLTESTAILTATPLDELRGDTVGRPVDGVSLKIHHPGEDGIGEVWAQGPSLMDGYYRNQEATEESLCDGWLRTGDLGRILPDGHLQITGRAKDLIVLSSGKNIYPDELEGHYGQGELVEEICIVGVADEEGRGERLHAVVVPDLQAARDRGYVNVREMIKWDLESIGAKLPGPQRLTSLEIRSEPLPRTPSRKIKRFVLQQEIAERGISNATDTELPSRSVRKESVRGDLPEWADEVQRIVARYAKVPSVGMDQHLDLDLGLGSLDRIELFAELEALRRVVLDDGASGRVHTVNELVDVLRDAGPASETHLATEVAPDNWAQVLSGSHDDLDRYLKRGPIFEWVMWAFLRGIRALWSLAAGFRVQDAARVPDKGAVIVCGNHASYLDPFIICMALPKHGLKRVFFVGYSEYFDGVVGRFLARLFRNIPIDANRNLQRAMQAAAEGLRRGMVLVIFPEGARSLDGTVKEFRRGAAILARNLNVPITPVGIRGAYEAWPREGQIRRHALEVQFGAALPPEDSLSDEALLGELRGEVIRLVDKSSAEHGDASIN
ncbi:MAG: AMP-binding protein, partial [Acidobacteriota bacterium]|nr:AMP-binding protein [Acidobacteriota bacterium]